MASNTSNRQDAVDAVDAVERARSGPAYEMRIEDLELQAYLQRYPMMIGPDEAMNARGREVVPRSLAVRPAAPPATTTELSPEEARLGPEEQARVLALMQQVGLSAALQAKHLNDFGWKVKPLRRSARRVLALGCGDGVELLFLRAVLPEAQFTAVDYYDGLLAGVKQASGVHHLVGDMNRLLGELKPQSFDLIFSNHTVEHFYLPDSMFERLHGLAAQGAEVASALPMCGAEGSPFLAEASAAIEHPATLLPVDAVVLDAGHPWKTNPADLKATLERAGFGDVRLLQRRDHLCRPLAADRAGLRRQRRSETLKNAIVIQPLRWLAKLSGAGWLGTQAARAVLAVDRRLDFGINRMMNRLCEEVLFTSVRRG